MKEAVQRYKTLREQAAGLKEKHVALRAEKRASDERVAELEKQHSDLQEKHLGRDHGLSTCRTRRGMSGKTPGTGAVKGRPI